MEKNNHTLIEALRRLPVYEPPSGNWEQIAAELDQDAASVQLRSHLKQLPSYQPPPTVWNQIEAALPSSDSKATARKVRLWPKIAAAAAVALVIVIGWWPKDDAANVQLISTQEVVPEMELQHDWDADEQSFEEVMQLAANTPIEDPENFNKLKEDLNELNQAKAELLELMDAYGKDPKVIRAIGEIERKRSAVLKQVVNLI